MPFYTYQLFYCLQMINLAALKYQLIAAIDVKRAREGGRVDINKIIITLVLRVDYCNTWHHLNINFVNPHPMDISPSNMFALT